MKTRIFSGVQPSGVIHLGNYLGAIKQWIEFQNKVDESIFCVVDLHAITLPQDPAELRKKILSVAALYLACGIDLKKSTIFVQSDRPEHSELAWILNCQARMGELFRMTQFKEKSAKGVAENASVGLFDYPILMAADILLYQTTYVPVGEDQKQHVELTRDLVTRFNNKFGQTFLMPDVITKKESARIMGLDDPLKKMSKSASSPNNYIAMTDSPDIIINKFKKAVTDSGKEIKARDDKPAITNLLNIYSCISGFSILELEEKFEGKTYGEFKESLADVVVEYLKPIQAKYEKIIKDSDELANILEQGSRDIAPIATETLRKVKEKVGLGVK